MVLIYGACEGMPKNLWMRALADLSRQPPWTLALRGGIFKRSGILMGTLRFDEPPIRLSAAVYFEVRSEHLKEP